MSVLIILCFIGAIQAANIPSFIQPCSASDPKLNECLEKVVAIAGPKFAEGIPELGIAPLDPVQLGTVPVQNPSLKLVFTDTIVTGLKNFRLNSIKMNPAKGKLALDFTANVTLKAHYDMDGQVLIIPLKGNGQTKIKITNLNIVVKYDYETQNGFWVIKSYKDTYKMDRAQFKFGNLFNGNQQLADTVQVVLNSNWEVVIRDIAPVAFEQIISKCVDHVRILFSQIPANQLLLE